MATLHAATILIVNEEELAMNRERLANGQPLRRIAPLESKAMPQLPLVIEAEHAGGYTLRLTFNEGSAGEVDFSP